MIKGKIRLITIALCAFILFPLSPYPLWAQEEAFVEQLMAQMSVEEKVGQLFMVTFVGSDLSPESDIAQLILDYKIGGVVLLASNKNFVNQGDVPSQVTNLTNGLQELAFASSQQEGSSGRFIPLFIAIDHEGDGYPYTRLHSGVTAVPNAMAIGATWREENAERVGEIVGEELAAMGINMLFGPSVDVLNTPRPGRRGDMGVRSFGGDPYWVSKLGRAYIRGVHTGSEGRVVTVAKHFPGHGGSDRSPDEEVATVNKSLQELSRIELPPFFAITQVAGEDSPGVTEALMTSHIRYRGFQGNIRRLTRPISFDAQGLQALMALPEFVTWREQGLLVSDALGVPAVRRYYDPRLQTFPYKQIAQEAFLAGNDLLLLSQFALTNEWAEQRENIKATIQFFRERYVADPDFQERIHESLRRILRLKHQLYPRFTLEESLVDLDLLVEKIGKNQGEVYQMARQAITLIYPGPKELADRLPSPPRFDENILIFTDARTGQDCPDCEPLQFIPPNALQDTILGLYGPAATGQVDPNRIHSLTFAQLKEFLRPAAEGEKEGEEMGIEGLIQKADWIIFAMLDLNLEDYPQSDAVKIFLGERSGSLPDKKIIALAYNAPYYLDTTEISKLTAYYGVYGKTPPFIKASVQALFQEFEPQGAPPVSVEGIGYDLVSQMEPDPEQLIEVMLADKFAPGTPTPIDMGETLRLRTGIILDRNGHPVPDGTPVVFRFFYPSDFLELPRQEVVTINGVAETEIVVDRAGQLEITAASGLATNSTKLVMNIQGEKPVIVITVIPSPPPPPTPSPSPRPTATPTVTPTVTRSPTPVPPTPTPAREEVTTETRRRGVDWGDFLLSMGSMILAGVIGHSLHRGQDRPLSRHLRLFLLALTFGLVGYLAYGSGLLKPRELPILKEMIPSGLSQRWEAPSISFLLALLPMASVLWQKKKERRQTPPEGSEIEA